MAGRGPSPKAIAARRATEAVSGPSVDQIDPVPEGLGVAGTALHKAILGDVADGFELDARELAILERACRLADLAARLGQEVEKSGLWVSGSTGQQRLNPAVSELRQCQASIVTLLGKVELGPPAPKTGHLNRRQRNQLRDVIAGG